MAGRPPLVALAAAVALLFSCGSSARPEVSWYHGLSLDKVLDDDGEDSPEEDTNAAIQPPVQEDGGAMSAEAAEEHPTPTAAEAAVEAAEAAAEATAAAEESAIAAAAAARARGQDALPSMPGADVLPTFESPIEFALLPAVAIAVAFSLMCGGVEQEEPQRGELGWRNWSNLIFFVVNIWFTYCSFAGCFGADNTTLGSKYQTLLTPNQVVFVVWAPIMTGHLVFAVAQMTPSFRNSKVVEKVSPGWLLANLCQTCWTVAYGQEMMPATLLCMLGILLGLLRIVWNTDGLPMSFAEYGLLRWVFSLHLGWIIPATALNVSLVADYWRAGPDVLLGLTVASMVAICIASASFALGSGNADPIVCLATAWCFVGIRINLAEPALLDDPARHNPHTWDRHTLEQLEAAATYATTLTIGLAAVAGVRAIWRYCCGS